MIANSLGECVYDDRTSVRFTVQVVARRGEIIQTGLETLGGSAGFELVDEAAARGVAATAAAKALAMLDSRPAPVGAMPVVLANGFGGVLFHEACGHGLEADAVAKGASIYAGKLGEVVAAPIVSAYDDGSHPQWLGLPGLRRRGGPHAEDAPDRGGSADRLSLRPAARPSDGRRADGQRTPPVVPTRAYPAHDDHLHRAR